MMIWMYLFLLLLGADTCDTWDTWAQVGDKRRYAAGEGEGGTLPIQEVYHRHRWARREYLFNNLKSRDRIFLLKRSFYDFFFFNFNILKVNFNSFWWIQFTTKVLLDPRKWSEGFQCSITLVGALSIWTSSISLTEKVGETACIRTKSFFRFSSDNLAFFIFGVAGFPVSEKIDEEKLRIVVNAD